ncbi:MAG: biopolymer transporter ExbD [Opitutaceae bacterium]
MLKLAMGRQSERRVRIDLSPMIDCIFILLIFFIVTSVFVNDPGIEVNKPDVRGAIAMDRNALLIAISAENRVYFEGQEIPLGQVASVIRQAAFNPDTVLIIRADQATSHGTFAGVYSEAKRAGVSRIQFATESTDDN